MTSDLAASVSAVPYWYHKIELPGGITTPGWAPISPAAYQIPDDMRGQVVLDVGAWDGYWSFEALRRGASKVYAIDDFSDTIGGSVNASRQDAWQTFNLCASALGYSDDRAEVNEMSVYEVEDFKLRRLVTFDTIFCFGVLYHLRHPLYALEKLRSVCSGRIFIETAILDKTLSPHNGKPHQADGCYAEFYADDQYGSNHSNWWVPTLRCAHEMVRAAGFRNVRSWRLTESPKHVSECRGFVTGDVW